MAEVSEPFNPSPEQASVLLVDDTPANLFSLRAILDDLNQPLVEARSGEEALERLKVEEFAVVLLDVLLPGLSGFETAKAIRNQERSRHTPIIFLTASDIDHSLMEEAYRLGAVDFLGKPLLPVAVRAKVRGFVELFQDKQKAKWEAEQLRLLVHGTADYAIFMLDPLGKVATWNAGAERLKGFKADEIIGQHFSKFRPQEAIDRGWPDYELKVATAEGRFEDEGWRVRKDGSQFWANVVITALRDEQGRLRGFSKVTRDLTERKEAEESLRQSEERFRHMVEGVQDYAIFMLDPHGNVATWNAGAERIKQHEAEEIIGQHFSKFYPQEPLDRGWPAHELKVAAAVGRFEDEGWRVRKDGSQFWANVVITALKDERGNLLGFSKITRDLTERKKAEESAHRLVEETTACRVAEENAQLIQEQRERLHVTLSSIGDAVISTDAEGRVEFLNPVAQELIGWRNEDASQRTLSDVFRIVNEETRQPVENPALRALKEGVVVGLANHTVLISKDGRERPIDDSAAPIKDSQGCVVGSVLVFRDITEKRQAQERLRVQQEWLRVTLASIGDAVIATDTKGRVTFLNPVAEGLTGWPQAEAQGEPLEAVFNILNERTRQPVENPVGRVLREGVIVGLGNHTILVTRDGTEWPIDDSAAPIRDATGKLIGVVLIFRDVTEQRRGQTFLADSEKRLRLALDAGRMGVWDWNLRTGDLNWSDTLEPLYGLAPGTFGGTLVDDLLDVSRITRNKLELRKEPVALATVIHTAVETSRLLIEQFGHTFSVTLTPTPVYLDADPVRLAQVFSNLLTNAAKYTQPGGRIFLTAEVHGAEAVVRDTGLGIPADALSRIFEMFSQVDRNLERAQGGLGIGLTLVRRLAEMHGGTVEAKSDGPGRGSEFVVRLPVLKDSRHRSEGVTTEGGGQARAKRRILVVDDNQDSATSLGMMLTLMGNEVRTAEDGFAAVEAAEEFRPDLILLDIGLPKLNEYDPCRRIREQPRSEGMVIVALTGWGQEEDRKRSREAGFDTHMVKPVEIAALERLLAGLTTPR
jgi:PAS domain S-box-containing protein